MRVNQHRRESTAVSIEWLASYAQASKSHGLPSSWPVSHDNKCIFQIRHAAWL